MKNNEHKHEGRNEGNRRRKGEKGDIGKKRKVRIIGTILITAVISLWFLIIMMMVLR